MKYNLSMNKQDAVKNFNSENSLLTIDTLSSIISLTSEVDLIKQHLDVKEKTLSVLKHTLGVLGINYRDVDNLIELYTKIHIEGDEQVRKNILSFGNYVLSIYDGVNETIFYTPYNEDCITYGLLKFYHNSYRCTSLTYAIANSHVLTHLFF